MIIVAEFRDSIGTAIPDIIALLCDGKVKVRLAAVDALAQLSEHGKYCIFYVSATNEDCSWISKTHWDLYSFDYRHAQWQQFVSLYGGRLLIGQALGER